MDTETLDGGACDKEDSPDTAGQNPPHMDTDTQSCLNEPNGDTSLNTVRQVPPHMDAENLSCLDGGASLNTLGHGPPHMDTETLSCLDGGASLNTLGHSPPHMDTENLSCLGGGVSPDTAGQGPPHMDTDTQSCLNEGSSLDILGQGLPHIDMETPSCLDGGVPLETAGKCPPNMDTETPGCLEGGDFLDTAGHGPPRIDSFSEMDTRPPLTPDTMIISDMDSQTGTFHMEELLHELPALPCQPGDTDSTGSSHSLHDTGASEDQQSVSQCPPCPLHIAIGKGHAQVVSRSSESDLQASSSRGLFLTDDHTGGLLSLFQYEGGTLADGSTGTPLATLDGLQSEEDSGTVMLAWKEGENPCDINREHVLSECKLSEPEQLLQENSQETLLLSAQYPAVAKVPGPCEPEDLLFGVVFGARYLGSTQLECERPQMANARMRQAQEAVDRVKAPEGESQPMTEVDVMISTERIKVLTANTQEALMDHPLPTISYTADIGSIVVIMAHRKSPRRSEKSATHKRPHRIICHVFQSVDAQLIAQAIGQAFAMAYHSFLYSEGVEPEQSENTHVTEQLYNADLDHFTRQDNCKEVIIQKLQGEVLGVTIVESGWGSLLPTVVIANLMHGGPAERCGELSIGDNLISVNGTSLVGLPFSTCQGLLRELKGQSEVTLRIVHCPPVVTAIIHRPNTTYQLGFCVEDGVICSLVRGGIAEKGGIRVGHRIIEINGQSVVATSHEKIIRTLLDATGEVHIKTMPAATYRLLTGQETPTYL